MAADAPAFDLAAVILAAGASVAEAATLDTMVAIARDAGATPVVVVLARGVAVPEGARVAAVAPNAKAISGLRAGMALLANSTARFVLLWPIGAALNDAPGISALVARARRERSALTAMDGADLDREPMIVARDRWLELMTIGEQGMNAFAARVTI